MKEFARPEPRQGSCQSLNRGGTQTVTEERRVIRRLSGNETPAPKQVERQKLPTDLCARCGDVGHTRAQHEPNPRKVGRGTPCRAVICSCCDFIEPGAEIPPNFPRWFLAEMKKETVAAK